MKKNFTINIPIKSFFFILLPILIIVSGLGVLGGIILIDKVVMPQIVGVNKDDVTVPQLEGMGWEEARQALYDVGLRISCA